MTEQVGDRVVVANSLIHSGVGPVEGARINGWGVITEVDPDDDEYRYAVLFDILDVRLKDGTSAPERLSLAVQGTEGVWVETNSVLGVTAFQNLEAT